MCIRDRLKELLVAALEAGSRPAIVSKEIAFGKSVHMVNASPVVEPNGETLGAVAVLRDITSLKKLETAKSMFVSMVAHELKSPLGAIEGYLNVILGGFVKEDSEKAREMMQRALARARALRTMVSELMNLTAMETGNFIVKRSPLEVGDIVAEAVESCREKAAAKNIELALHSTDGVEEILADRDAMLSVFTNLIDNAIKYTPEKGHINVDVGSNGLYVNVAVCDDGIGMTDEETEKAFEEFFRARNQYTARVAGTGLGLSLAKRFIEMHQGRITVRSRPGKGSTFTVSLPALGDDGEESERGTNVT